MTNEEAIKDLKHDCRKMCQDCYPEIGRGGSENCDFCDEFECIHEQDCLTAKINGCENCISFYLCESCKFEDYCEE